MVFTSRNPMLPSGSFASRHALLARASRRFAIISGAIFIDRRQWNRQIVFAHCMWITLRIINDGEWFTPITLTRKQPVSQLVLHFMPGPNAEIFARRSSTAVAAALGARPSRKSEFHHDLIGACSGRSGDDLDHWQIKLQANCLSRSSSLGTPMIAPVP